MITIGYSTRKIDNSYIEHIKKTCGNKKVQIINCCKYIKYQKLSNFNMSKIVKCPSCDCHIVVNEKGQKEFCIKDNSN